MPLVPIEWLGSHVELPAGLTPEGLAAALVRVGLEEETIHAADVAGPVVVGRVLTRQAEEHKNGKVVNYCRVDVGQHNDAPGTGKEPSDLPSRGIVCGAHNFDVGDYVVVSLPGAVLPGGFAISARKTYGHLSDGMICSMRELGLGEDHDGIIVLAAAGDAEAASGLPAVGEDALAHLGLGERTLEINVTPDRGYCFSMRGIAREYHHSTGAPFADPGLPESLDAPIPSPTPDGFPVEVRDGSPIHGNVGCDRFVTRVVRGIDPTAESPKWLRDRLTAAGMRPISLAVDATNYVMLDLGQPLHAYDLGRLRGPIVVRRARAGERHTTLDGVERTLDAEDLLITDSGAERVLGIAGVMGGADTEITEATVDVLVEAAHFDPVSIARSARRHKLPSEASKRFERGVDPELPPVAAQRVVDLLVEYGGGSAGEASDLSDVRPVPPIDFSASEVARLTGLDVADERIAAILADIGCAVEGAGDAWRVTPPTWRFDLTGPAHLVEEVARLVGYDEIPTALPQAPAGRGLTAVQRQRRDLARALAEQGWVQVLSSPFVGAGSFDAQGIPGDDPRRLALRLSNPLQEEAPYMRTCLLDSLLETVRLNVARANPAVGVFETGLVTRPEGIRPAPPARVGRRPSDAELDGLAAALAAQPLHVAGVACGPMAPVDYGFAPPAWDWRDAVEAVETAARTVGARTTRRAAERAPWHPGRCAQIFAEGAAIGWAGELAPAVCAAFDLPARSVAFEFDADALCAAARPGGFDVRPILTPPAAKEDIALVVDADVTAGELEDVVREAAGPLLEDLRLFDVYTGEQVAEGRKSLAFALRLRGEATLTAEETARVRKRVLKAARKAFGAELRA
ncbi:phenylalanine--tRNA ligase, beta subunit [Actinobaculum sp. oral taxon 183 str. F0552]|uniref:phenylalanine--tRNA ligase subunit beta n=1 Tax=Actinobaculum sp. oral taxon 183 TaxID=712888 RepID=UPI000396A1A9|nr:phenylalanine--tRNA ligase subunit beta [Actinobaculum sp. oral taxon 183]ERH16257.1 phenylalanine--tRNA ligase, beta subunit [Actinobaculum sp. oral taxon 183 str. F0552]